MDEQQAPQKGFRVIIVGGSIAGLTLAHSLRKYRIEYVVLEARGEIAPQVGASIGFLSNGSGILDQLGVFDDIQDQIEPLKTSFYWTKSGRLISKSDASITIQERHGYPIAFLDRQKVLEILYNRLEDHQSKVFLNKRVAQVEQTASGAIVHCEDGSLWTGDLVVGADGVNSAVRSEMWKHMEKLQMADLVAREKTEMVSMYSCVFGISNATKGLKAGEMHRTLTTDISALTIVGKNDRVFWFFFAKMDRKYTFGNIPRFNSDDLKQHISQHLDLIIRMDPVVRLGDIWKNVLSTAYVPLEEAFYKQWTCGRMVCIGDSIHKMTPNMGQGGNNAVESAASLANTLRTFLDTSPTASYHMDDLCTTLSAWAAARRPRAKGMWTKANDLTRLEAWAGIKHRLITFCILPYATNYLVDSASSGLIGAEVLEYLPTGKLSQQGTMPADTRYRNLHDEPFWKRLLYSIPLVLCFAFACFAMSIEPVVTYAEPLIERGVFKAANVEAVELARPFFNQEGLDDLLSVLVTCFLPSLSGSDYKSQLQMLSFLTDLAPIYGIWMLESYRRSHSRIGALFPIIMGVAFQLRGIGKVAPIYFLIDFIQSPLWKIVVADRATIRLSAAKSLLPALIIAYYLPTWAMFAVPSLLDRQYINAIWQIFPVLVPVVQLPLYLVTSALSSSKPSSNGKRTDMGYLRFTIAMITVVSGAAFLFVRFSVPEGSSLSDVFLPPLDFTSPVSSFEEAIARFLRYDEVFAMASCLIWVLLSFRDLSLYGMSVPWFRLIVVLAATTIGLGPGAAFAIGWAWREEYLASIRG